LIAFTAKDLKLKLITDRVVKKLSASCGIYNFSHCLNSLPMEPNLNQQNP